MLFVKGTCNIHRGKSNSQFLVLTPIRSIYFNGLEIMETLPSFGFQDTLLNGFSSFFVGFSPIYVISLISQTSQYLGILQYH